MSKHIKRNMGQTSVRVPKTAVTGGMKPTVVAPSKPMIQNGKGQPSAMGSR